MNHEIDNEDLCPWCQEDGKPNCPDCEEWRESDLYKKSSPYPEQEDR